MKFEFSAGVVIYTYKGGKRRFLFLDRADMLDVPKGHIEEGENAEDAARRETREEAGIADLRLDRYFRDEMVYWHMKSGEKIKKHVTLFLSRVADDTKVKTSFEHTGFEWLTLDEAMRKLKFKDQKELAVRVNDYVDRLEAMEELNREYAQLPKKYKDWDLSTKFVPGHGPLNAMMMFVGQAPGRNEDSAAEPFVGAAGKFLNTMIRRAGLKREKVYITSIVQFFPPDNRLPTEEETKRCMPFLKRQIAIVKPKLIVSLGNYSTQNLVGLSEVNKNHGRIVKSEYGDVFITLHPAAAVRIKANVPTVEKDFDKLKEIISRQTHKA